METYDKYDIQSFSDDLGLSTKDIADLYDELIQEINNELHQLKHSIHDNDLQSAREIMHNLKGISGNYRITDIHEQTVKIQAVLKNMTTDNLEPLFENYFTICHNAIIDIKLYFEQAGR